MNLIKLAINVIVDVPVAVVKDVFTLGGACMDEPSYTMRTLKEVRKDLERAGE